MSNPRQSKKHHNLLKANPDMRPPHFEAKQSLHRIQLVGKCSGEAMEVKPKVRNDGLLRHFYTILLPNFCDQRTAISFCIPTYRIYLLQDSVFTICAVMFFC